MSHIIFGTGPVGLAIMQELVKRGETNIKMVNRSGKGNVPAGVQIIKGDATDPEFTKQVSQGASVIYHALNVLYHQWFEFFPKLNKGMIAAAESSGATLVVMDNLYMHDTRPGKPFTEDMPYDAKTRKGKLRAELAQELLEAHRQGRIKLVIVRASDFFGPGVEASAMGGSRVIVPAIQGKGVQIMGKADVLHTYSYVPDVAKAMVMLGGREEALGKVWHVPVAETLTTRQFIEQIYKETGGTAKIQPAPKIAVRILGLFNPVVREIVEMLPQFEQDYVMSGDKFKSTFGDIATPLDKAIHETVTYFKNQ